MLGNRTENSALLQEVMSQHGKEQPHTYVSQFQSICLNTSKCDFTTKPV